MRKKGRHYNVSDPLTKLRMRQNIPSDIKTKLSIIGWASLDRIRKGKADRNDYEALCATINCSLVLVRDYKQGDEHLGILLKAKDAMGRLKYNGRERGKWLMLGDDAKVVGQSLELFDAQMELITSHRMVAVIEQVLREAVSPHLASTKEPHSETTMVRTD